MQKVVNGAYMKDATRRLPIHWFISNWAMDQNRTVLFKDNDALALLQFGAGSTTIVSPTVANDKYALSLGKRIPNHRRCFFHPWVE